MKEQWQQARNILCIRLDYLGDVLMCTPAIRALKASIPGSRVTLLTSGSGAAAVPFIPEIDESLVYAAPWLKNSQPHGATADFAFMDLLREKQFDAVVIFTTYSQSPLPSAMMCYLAGIPLRLAHCRENPYQLLTDWIPDPEPEKTVRHEVQRQLDLVASIGCETQDKHLSFRVRENDRQAVRQRLDAIGIAPDRRWILCHPGATAASRRYPAAHWAAAIRALVDQSGIDVVLTGSAEESDLIEQIRSAAGAPVHSLAGQLTLGELGAAISLAAVVISNNTGPAHMAAAIGTPIVDLYALTNPQHSPWMVKSEVLFHDVPCRFCYKSVCPQGHHHCLTKVEPEAVTAAAQALLPQSLHTQSDHNRLLAELFRIRKTGPEAAAENECKVSLPSAMAVCPGSSPA
jgi:lipopolysaccharide heptosyltransferase II